MFLSLLQLSRLQNVKSFNCQRSLKQTLQKYRGNIKRMSKIDLIFFLLLFSIIVFTRNVMSKRLLYFNISFFEYFFFFFKWTI